MPPSERPTSPVAARIARPAQSPSAPTQVLDGVDLDVARGEVVTVIGASGSGKTTLLRCVNVLETYDGGSIQIDGVEVGFRDGAAARRRARASASSRRIRAETGMVFQLFNLFPHLTARENVMLGLRKVRRMASAEARGIAEHWLDRVGLADKLDSLPSQLSGGQQQRVGIARAVAMEPKVLLLDEITSALDPGAGRRGAGGGARARRRRHDDDRGHPRDGLRPRRQQPRRLHGRRPHRGRRAGRERAAQPDARAAQGLPVAARRLRLRYPVRLPMAIGQRERARRMDIMEWQDWVGNFSYLMLAASYLVTNMYWLRGLAIVALGLEGVYFFFSGAAPLWVGIGWAAVFVGINAVQLAIMARNRLRVRLSGEEHGLHQQRFGKLDQVNFDRLARAGHWRNVPPGTVLARGGPRPSTTSICCSAATPGSTAPGAPSRWSSPARSSAR